MSAAGLRRQSRAWRSGAFATAPADHTRHVDAMRGLMELPPPAVVIGIALAVAAHCLHPSTGNCGVFG